jgi:hypothetical protein
LGQVIEGQALDVILINGSDGNNTNEAVSCNDFSVTFWGAEGLVRIQANGCFVEGLDMLSTKRGCHFVEGLTKKPGAAALGNLLQVLNNPDTSSTQSLFFHLFHASSNTVIGVAECRAFQWRSTDKVVICDLDGTVTKSNVRGVWDTVLTETYQYLHDGVCSFLQSLVAAENRRILYLTSRPISIADRTRKFLLAAEQNGVSLPEGPLLCNLRHLASVLLSELIWKDAHKTKQETLRREVILPFAAVSLPNAKGSGTLVCGIGNSDTDSKAYEMVGIPLARIFQINKRGLVQCMNTSNMYFEGYKDPALLDYILAKLDV